MADYVFDTQAGEWMPHPRVVGAFLRPLISAAQNPGLTVWRVRLLPGVALPAHRHPNSTETFYIITGVAVCRVGEAEFEMRPGQMGYAPPGVEHSVCNAGIEALEALSIFNPPL